MESDLALEVRLKATEQVDEIVLGRAARYFVAQGSAPCDPVHWDASAPCRRLFLTSPTSGLVRITIAWEGQPELDAVLMTPGGDYLATSGNLGATTVVLTAMIDAGQRYEVRVNSYYGSQVFELTAELLADD